MAPSNVALLSLAIVVCAVAADHILQRLIKTRIRQRTRHAERERIARDLHDTVLQGIQALLFRLQLWAEDLELPQNRRHEISVVVEQAKAIISEGRKRIVELRDTDREGGDFLDALAGIKSSMPGGPPPICEIQVSGRVRPIALETAQQLVDIAREAMLNAYRHARCAKVDVAVTYAERYLRLTISDDGLGIRSTARGRDHRSGHFGILGMQERALQLKARLLIGADGHTGTKVSITVPANVAFINERVTFLARLAKSKETTVSSFTQ